MPIEPARDEPHPPASTGTAVFDWHDALHRMQGDAAFLEEVCTLFLEESVPTRAALVRAAEASDLPRLEQLAHSLCGSSGMLSAAHLSGLARETERLASAGSANAVERTAELVAALDALTRELRARGLGGERAA